MLLSLLCTSVVVASSASVNTGKPHIVVLLVDDLGYGNVGWHRPDLPQEVKTPTMDKLVSEGIELQRFYAFKYCSPTRSALQTGRNPIHVNVANGRTDLHNPDDPISGYSGIPRNMTGIATKLASAGYAAHAVGKWDVGIATLEHTPLGRGYQTWLGYFGHCNDYWNQVDKCGMKTCGNNTAMLDLWWQNSSQKSSGRGASHPAKDLINPASCSQSAQEGCVHEDERFTQHALRVIREHPLDGTPLFLFWATHGIHGPLEVPQSTYDKFSAIDKKSRRMYASLVNYVDAHISQVVELLKTRGMWENTIFLMTSDNGGDASANNWPLRGAKFSNWEGGIHVPAFVSGGAIPSAMRGTQLSGLAAVWDFYATLCDVAGVDPEDHAAAAAGLPAVDSVSQWPYWSGKTAAAPREELAIGAVYGNSHGEGNDPVTTIEGLIKGRYKLLLGTFDEAIWTGPQFPNKTSADWDASVDCSSGCLFDLVADPSEHNDLAASQPDVVAEMLARMKELNRTVFSPKRGVADPLGCETAINKYGGVWGPFLELEVEHQQLQHTIV